MDRPRANPEAALARAAREIDMPRTPKEALEAIVRAAHLSLPDVDHVGVSIAHRGGDIETVVGTSPLVWELDALQYELGEGPCLHAIEAEPIVVVAEMRHEQRWPAYVARALRRGIRGQVGVRLYVEEETLGGLNLYATREHAFNADLVRDAELFATHAALALGRARRESQLTEAMASRKVIGQAIGLLMERYQLDEKRAFQFLSRISSTSNVKIRDVAQELVVEAERKAAAELPD